MLTIYEMAAIATDAGLEAEAIRRLTDRVFMSLSERDYTYLKPATVNSWLLPNAKGEMVKLNQDTWHVIIRTVMHVPRDGKWYIMDMTKALTQRQRTLAVRAVRQWYRRAGYKSSELHFMSQTSGGIAVRWHDEPKPPKRGDEADGKPDYETV